MKTLKKILIVVLVIIAIPLVMALFVPKEFKGESKDFNEDFETGTQNLKTVLEAQKSPDLDLKELVSYYDKTYTNLVNSVKGLTDNQLHFKPASDQWSVAQCVEHITLTAPKLFDYLKTALDAPENPERKSEVETNDEELLASMTNRDYKVKTSEDLEPDNSSAIDVDGRLEELKMHNTEILEYVDRFTMEGLRNRIMDAPFGAVDAYQFALFIPGHTARHTLQIEEVKSDPGYPDN